jgi:hypothetical protein
MAIKEFKSFFLRNTVVTGGAEPDQELAFPTQYFVTIDGVPTQKYNRFLKNHFPSESVFRKLFDSIPFFLNASSTADYNSSGEQGLVKAATDVNAIARTSRASTVDKTTVLQPHQMIEVVTVINGLTDVINGVPAVVNGLTITKYIRTIGTVSRQIYLLEVPTVSSIPESKYRIVTQMITDTNAPAAVAVYDFTTIQQDINGLLDVDGDEVEIEVGFRFSSALTQDTVYEFNCKFGTFAYPFNRSIIHASIIFTWNSTASLKYNIKRIDNNNQRITITSISNEEFFTVIPITSSTTSIVSIIDWTNDLSLPLLVIPTISKFDINGNPLVTAANEAAVKYFTIKKLKQ